MARWMIALCSLLGLTAVSALAQGRDCSIAQDLIVQARERSYPGASRAKLEDARQLLKSASNFCPSLGDAYYYRYLCSRQLGNQQDADYALKKAEEWDSDALKQRIDPFTLSTAAASEATKFNATEVKTLAATKVREKWALVVGISKFHASQLDPKHSIDLDFSAKDARDFAALLVDKNYGRFKSENVKVLTDDQATRVQIMYGLSWLAENAQKDDLVVIYVSSHGSPREADVAGVSYVITYDTDLSEAGLYATSLPMVDIVSAVQNRIKAQRAAVFLDTCFSGSVVAGAKALTFERGGVSNETLERFRQGVGRVIVTASQANEISYESKNLRNGFFTYYLIEGMKLSNGRAPITQVYQHLKDRVLEAVRAEKKKSQTPAMSKSDRAVEFSLGLETQSP